MRTKLTRREFLKLAGLLSLDMTASRFLIKPGVGDPSQEKENVLIIVFDALSAYHISLYGYARETMPNLARLAEKAVVYQNHYAGGNYTTTGTASLLTGTLPWSHRAFEGGARVAESVAKRNIFEAFNSYYRIAYSHNKYAIAFLEQFFSDDDHLIPYENLIIEGEDLVSKLFKHDEDIASVAWIRALKQKDLGYSYSLFLSQVDAKIQASNEKKFEAYARDFPRGLPYTKQDNHFLLEQAIDYVTNELTSTPQPYIGYFHFFPPHRPYHTRKDFYEAFRDDGYVLPQKPHHVFSEEAAYEDLSKWCDWYDEYILYVDAEFARFYEYMERTGILDHTWLILTSDHGELFERGVVGHSTPLLYEPVIRVPLLIFEPGRVSRLDIHDPTSAIDVLPTLLHLTHQEIPGWAEGIVLPPYSTEGLSRDIFVLDSRNSKPDAPITEGTTTVIQDNYKLISFEGYQELENIGDIVELYDLKNDPGELNNISDSQKEIAEGMQKKIKAKLNEVNQAFI